jgi:DNA-binding Lrp family transcriptional regulator
MLDKSQKIQLLETLYQNAKLHDNDLESTLHISRQTISKLRSQHWKDFTIQTAPILLNPIALNLQYVFMEIKTNPAEPHLLSKLKQLSGIQSIDGVIGEYALVIKFEMRNKYAFSQLLNEIDHDIAQTLFQSYRIIETIDVYKNGGVIFNRNTPYANIDDKKWDLLSLLSKNHNLARWPERILNEFFTNDQLSLLEKTNLSREFERYEQLKLIERYTITTSPVNAKLPDFHTKFLMRIKPKTVGQYNELAHMLKFHPNIIELYRTGEDAGLFAVVRTEGLKGFKKFIEELYTQYPVIDSYTTVVIDEHLPTIFPPTLRASKKECDAARNIA